MFFIQTMIPRIVHQTSKTEEIPVIFQKILEKNKEVYSDYEFKHWYDTEGKLCIPSFLKQEYPDIFPIFDKAKLGVQKSDIARLAILHFYGGVYADMDIAFLKSSKDIIDHTSDYMYIAMEPVEQTKMLYGKSDIPCNAFIVSPPKHPIIVQALEEIKNLYKTHGDLLFNIFNVFGNDIITKCILTSENAKKQVKFINRDLIYPIADPKLENLTTAQNNIQMLRDNSYNGAYMVHYWIHSNFESADLLQKFDYNNEKSVNDNIYRFFKLLYTNHMHLKD